MNDVKVTVNFGTFVVVMIVWIVLFSVIVIQSIQSPTYDMPDVLMNLFMLITGSVMTIFQGFEKGVTFKTPTDTTLPNVPASQEAQPTKEETQ